MSGVALVNFKSMLTGENAFYKQPDYKEKTKEDLSRVKALPPSYVVQFESKILRIAKLIFSIIIFPIFIYTLLHNLIGRIVYPATFMETASKISDNLRDQIDSEGPWKYKRFSIEVDGNRVDATLIGKETTLDNGRYVLKTVGNGMSYEVDDPCLNVFLDEIEGNAVLIDVPGVGATEGGSYRSTIAKAHRAMVMFMEDQQGLAAKEIIFKDFSIGTVVRAEGLKDHTLQDNINYLGINDRGLRSVSAVVGLFLGCIVTIAGWNQSADNPANLNLKEIVIVTVKGDSKYDLIEISESSHIENDGVIPAESTYAKMVLDRKIPNKIVLGTHLRHNDGPVNPVLLAGYVNALSLFTKS